MTPATLKALLQAAADRKPAAFAKRLSDGAEFLLPDPDAPPALNAAGRAALAADKTGTQSIGAETWFIEARNLPPRLVIIGAVHIAQSLVPMARMAGFAVTVVDPRRAFCNADRFPGVDLLNEWPDTALETLRPDARTAIVTLRHDPKLDDPALNRALRSEAFYIGALGSRGTHATRLSRLAALGHADAAISRIHGPVGLNIGAVTAPEIAISIIAEIIAARRNGVLALPTVAALVLAAGSSSRTGPHNKLLAPMPDGRTMIAQTVDNVLASTASPVIVVTGHDDADIRKALAGKPVRFVHAVNYADGMAASLRTGIASLAPSAGAVLICLGDMPLVEPLALNSIIAAYNLTEGGEIVLPCFAGQRGNPVLWGKRFFPELLKLSGDTGARQILHRHVEFVTEVPVATDSVLRDFDTPESLAGLAR